MAAFFVITAGLAITWLGTAMSAILSERGKSGGAFGLAVFLTGLGMGLVYVGAAL